MKQLLIFLVAPLCIYALDTCENCIQPQHCLNLTETIFACECISDFATFPMRNSTKQCNYQRKKQWIAFVLEAVVAFGAGHFYSGNYSKAVPKFLVWVIAWVLFAMMRIMSVKREIEDPLALVYALWSFLICVIIIIWYITDVVMIALNRYHDGNGIEMIYW